MEEIISLKNVNYSYYGKIPALNNINLSVKKGEMFSIIGLNGCGKSTLLNVINALIVPDSGEILFDGNPVTEKSLQDKDSKILLRQRMGYVFQNPDIQLFCPTVFDELLFAPLQNNLPYEVAEERAEQTLSYLGIEYLKERPVFMLSGGEKKKVAIASVLTMNPDVLLIDEPISSLDPKTQTSFIDLIIELNRAGKTIIFTTHHLDLIDHLQPRVAILSEDHTIEKTGTASEILTDEKFLISINLIHAHVHRHGDEVHKHYHSHYIFHQH
ncbi:MAG TPA: ABC transporter ATP-binding protein [Bacteroidales bacterium]|nr:ABC transporter ATP-binding protein [Bacteroidales bacterium]HPT21220.1 ABC transporter ATP-binding protein [Bacteroidales bacterium]